jgi:hypothetical protein
MVRWRKRAIALCTNVQSRHLATGSHHPSNSKVIRLNEVMCNGYFVADVADRYAALLLSPKKTAIAIASLLLHHLWLPYINGAKSHATWIHFVRMEANMCSYRDVFVLAFVVKHRHCENVFVACATMTMHAPHM